MKFHEWSKEKNDNLKKERGIGFEEIVLKLIKGEILDVISNPSRNFPNQKIFVIEINNYIYYVPYVEDKEKIFLKTIIPSRKLVKKYQNRL